MLAWVAQQLLNSRSPAQPRVTVGHACGSWHAAALCSHGQGLPRLSPKSKTGNALGNEPLLSLGGGVANDLFSVLDILAHSLVGLRCFCNLKIKGKKLTSKGQVLLPLYHLSSLLFSPDPLPRSFGTQHPRCLPKTQGWTRVSSVSGTQWAFTKLQGPPGRQSSQDTVWPLRFLHTAFLYGYFGFSLEPFNT